MKCPERFYLGEDEWREDQTCSYCGSINPEVFMAGIEDGSIILGPTDKSTKVYVRSDTIRHGKFYFSHMNTDQMCRFVELYNQKKLQFDSIGGFYVLPFFMRTREV